MPVDDGHFCFQSLVFLFMEEKSVGIDPDKLEDEEQGHHQHAGVDLAPAAGARLHHAGVRPQGNRRRAKPVPDRPPACFQIQVENSS